MSLLDDASPPLRPKMTGRSVVALEVLGRSELTLEIFRFDDAWLGGIWP